MALLSKTAPSCSETLSLPSLCSRTSNGVYVLKLQGEPGRFIFPEVYCEEDALTLLVRKKTDKPTTFRDREEIRFHYNQIGENIRSPLYNISLPNAQPTQPVKNSSPQ